LGSSAFSDAKCEIKEEARMFISLTKGRPMDTYDVIGLVIAIVAVSVVLLH
jgi:hypothetical protein